MKKHSSNLVYSTESGRVKSPKTPESLAPSKDGVVRIQRESKGRGGKVVCVITGLPSADLKPLCKLMKARCGSGGAVKDQRIEIQGDHRETIRSLLEAKGLTVKFAGG
ncbi:MAG: stress response translation initiation inhibitor YciH [Proteobacteria bacterium]|nr:stress response translation initiation inhibitor YciH [Pseudomonadota bacterium]